MHPILASPFIALETSFGLLVTGPAPLALDGQRLRRGLPARPIPLDELTALLLHPAVRPELQHVVLQELTWRAQQDDDRWVVGLAGVLLPGLRRLAQAARPANPLRASRVEADLLQQLQTAVSWPQPRLVLLATSLIEAARSDPETTPIPAWRRA